LRLRARPLFALVALTALVPGLVHAQVTFSNLLQAQAGNVPFTTPTNRTGSSTAV
jgi:hypothetical protein